MTVPIRFTAATGRYQQYHADMGVAVRTTVGHPRFVRYPLVNIPELAPHGVFGNRSLTSVPNMIAAYTERMDAKSADIIRVCNKVAREHGGQRLVFLCFDDVHPPVRDYCHRTWLAAWFRERHDMILPELQPRPAPSPEQGELF